MFTRTNHVRHIMRINYSICIFVGLLFASNGWAQDKKPPKPPEERQLYFGEQHLHTSASPDAFAFGTRNDANDAYRYAKGEPIKNAQTGQRGRPMTGLR